MRTLANASRDVNVCVVCFCKERDLLSQWRGYSSGSYGYSIGFNTDKLNNLASSSNFVLGYSIYDKAHQQNIVKEICDYYLQGSITDSLALISKFTASIIESGAFFKDASFSEEAEWGLFPAHRGKKTSLPGRKINDCPVLQDRHSWLISRFANRRRYCRTVSSYETVG